MYIIKNTFGQFTTISDIMVTKCLCYRSLRETSLDGHLVSCFNVGGEDRLCLTQLLQLVLHDIPLARIHQVRKLWREYSEFLWQVLTTLTQLKGITSWFVRVIWVMTSISPWLLNCQWHSFIKSLGSKILEIFEFQNGPNTKTQVSYINPKKYFSRV